ncbi:hypothetical protein AKG95_02860 [Janthinobacterium lividum]|uniref:Uncharacterized protein n=1 Tax=Janthinobacterium lividum TaxID=29581 RepID=A0A1S1UEM5_9BURK|nr:hypothetical protein AKG95_02860 [Janthinobacterium lividum]
MAILALSDERMLRATILFPCWCVAAKGDDFSFTSGRGNDTEFPSIAIGRVGRIIWTPIQEDAVNLSCLQFRGWHAICALWNVAIEKTDF